MGDPWVKDYLSKKVIGTLKEYGFGYMKIDYNETIGAGCDGAESIGEGIRQNMQASADFIEKVKAEVPGIVLENCSSGGHRLEPGLMAQMSMASFSDAHECEEIPIIAANLHRVIHPVQSQIWAVIHIFDGELPEEIQIPLHGAGKEVTGVYSEDPAGDAAKLRIENDTLIYRPKEQKKAVAILLN